MGRNYFKKLSLTLVVMTLCSALQGSNKSKKANILFIITDDQDAATLDAYDDNECDTPNLDRLAQNGIVITGAHQMGSYTGAVSTASRTMLMTGMNVWNAQVLRNKMTKYEKPSGNANVVKKNVPEYNSLPALFHRAGYETVRTCKRGNSYEPANALFDERFDKVCRMAEDQNGSKWHADHVIEYFKRRSKQNRNEIKPFFVYLGFSHPHDARHGKPELLEKYGAEDIDVPTKLSSNMPSIPANWLPAKTFPDGHPDLRDEHKVKGVMTRRDEITIRNEKGKEFACIENIDIQIGRVLDVLEDIGELDNTYIFFTSDHGIAVGKHAYMGKQNLYEHTFRVPFLVSGPTIPKNERKKGNIYLMDVLPTLCDIVGIQTPNVNGKSFKSVIEGNKEQIRDVLYGAYSGGTKPGIRCVKQGDWKLIKYDVLDGTVRETLLFNLKENPNELTKEHHDPDIIKVTKNRPQKNQINLAEDSRYKEKLAEMEIFLLDQMQQVGDPYRLWNQEKHK